MTADQCAQMKGDVLKVQPNRAEERAWARGEDGIVEKASEGVGCDIFQAVEVDSNGVCGGNVVFDCSQRDAAGQEVLSTLVKAHSIILKK